MPCGNHNPNKTCTECGKLGKGKGFCSNCGLFKRANKCHDHSRHGKREYTKFKKETCEKCNGTEKLTVHHIDENPKNNVKENCMTLCEDCHNELHGFIKRKYRHARITTKVE